MKKIAGWLLAFGVLGACQDHNEVKQDDFTGNQSIYALLPGSTYATSGTVTFKEKKDGSADIVIKLSGTNGDVKLPVHLHLGDITASGTPVTALLNPVSGKTGASETHLTKLADESAITYKQLKELNACIKIHLSDAGPDKDVILAAGNIGTIGKDISNGRAAIGVCKSE